MFSSPFWEAVSFIEDMILKQVPSTVFDAPYMVRLPLEALQKIGLFFSFLIGSL